MTENERDAELVAQGLLRQDEIRLSQKIKTRMIDLRRRTAELEQIQREAANGDSQSAISLREGMDRTVVGSKYTSASVATNPDNRSFQCVDVQLCRTGARKGWVQVMGSGPFQMEVDASNVIYLKPRY